MTFIFSYIQDDVKLIISTEYISHQIDTLFTNLAKSGVSTITLEEFDDKSGLVYDHVMNCVTRHPEICFETKNCCFYEDGEFRIRAGCYPIQPSEIEDVRLLSETERITSSSLAKLARSFPDMTSLTISANHLYDSNVVAENIHFFENLTHLVFECSKVKSGSIDAENLLLLIERLDYVSIYNDCLVASTQGIHEPKLIVGNQKELKAYFGEINITDEERERKKTDKLMAEITERIEGVTTL